MKHRKPPVFAWFSWVLLIVFMAFLISLVVANAASATPKAVDLPGVEVCPKAAPFAQTPESGLAGLVGERPVQITTDISPEHIWSTGGFAGLRSNTYDLGCAIDPTSWTRVASASTETGITNTIKSVGDAVVSLTDSVDRRAWSPGWVLTFLEGFADRVMTVLNASILIPFLGVGMIAGAVIMLSRAHTGDMKASASNVGWVLLVMTVTGLLVMAPLMLPKAAQGLGGGLVATLNSGTNASDAATNQVVFNVQYQGWLRRTFGSAESVAAKEFGPQLLDSTRVSWAELDAITALPADKQGDARAKLTEKKAEQFEDIAAKIKEADPTAYRYVTGAEPSAVEALVEVIFVLASSGFRLAAALLMIIATMTLVLIGVLWVAFTPALVLPRIFRFSGQEVGLGLANSAVQAMVYVAGAALGSFLFGVYLRACLAPGMSLWWSMLLLIIGSSIAWVVLSPIQKALSIISLGRVNGYGVLGRWLTTAAIAYFTGRVIRKGIDEDESGDADAPPAVERLPEDTPARPPVYADIYHPDRVFTPERPTTVDADGLPVSETKGLPSAAPVYERGGPTPPADESTSSYQQYERPADRSDADDNEGANR